MRLPALAALTLLAGCTLRLNDPALARAVAEADHEQQCRDWFFGDAEKPADCGKYAAAFERELEAKERRAELERQEREEEEARRRADPVGYCTREVEAEYDTCQEAAITKADAELKRVKRGASYANIQDRLVPVSAETDGIVRIAELELSVCNSKLERELRRCERLTPDSATPRAAVPGESPPQ